MSRESETHRFEEIFIPTQESYIPLSEIIEDPRLSESERYHYQMLIEVSDGQAWIKEYYPDGDLSAPPVTEIVLGPTPNSEGDQPS